MAFMKSGSPFLYDDKTGDIVGIKDPDGSESLFVTNRSTPLDATPFYTEHPPMEDFSRFADWTYSVSGPNAAMTNAAAGMLKSYCINVTSNAIAGSNAMVTADRRFDMSAQNGYWQLVRANYRQTSSQIGLTVYLAQSTGLGSAVGRWSSTSTVGATAVSVQPHWVPKSAFSVLDGAPDFANPILSWRFRLDSNTEIHNFDLLGVVTSRERPCVLIGFDDGWATSYTAAFPEAQKRAIPLSHFLIASTIGTAGYITAAQAQAMAAAGDYLGLHGVARWGDDPSLIASDKAGLMALGLSDCEHAAYPEGAIGDGTTWRATEAAMTAAGVKTARLTGPATPTLRRFGDMLALTAYPLNNSMTLAQAKAVVDTAISSNGTVIFYAHKIAGVADSLTWVTSDWIALLDYIFDKRMAGSIDVKTIKQWYEHA